MVLNTIKNKNALEERKKVEIKRLKGEKKTELKVKFQASCLNVKKNILFFLPYNQLSLDY